MPLDFLEYLYESTERLAGAEYLHSAYGTSSDTLRAHFYQIAERVTHIAYELTSAKKNTAKEWKPIKISYLHTVSLIQAASIRCQADIKQELVIILIQSIGREVLLCGMDMGERMISRMMSKLNQQNCSGTLSDAYSIKNLQQNNAKLNTRSFL